jgi:hypothetical protein
VFLAYEIDVRIYYNNYASAYVETSNIHDHVFSASTSSMLQSIIEPGWKVLLAAAVQRSGEESRDHHGSYTADPASCARTRSGMSSTGNSGGTRQKKAMKRGGSTGILMNESRAHIPDAVSCGVKPSLSNPKPLPSTTAAVKTGVRTQSQDTLLSKPKPPSDLKPLFGSASSSSIHPTSQPLPPTTTTNAASRVPDHNYLSPSAHLVTCHFNFEAVAVLAHKVQEDLLTMKVGGVMSPEEMLKVTHKEEEKNVAKIALCIDGMYMPLCSYHIRTVSFLV